MKIVAAFLHFAELTQSEWLTLIICGGVLVLIIAILVIALIVRKNNKDPRKNLQPQIPNFENPLMNKQREMFITISRGQVASVGKDAEIKPGTYILRSAEGGKGKFSLRYNGIVRIYEHGSKLNLGEGDSLAGVAESVMIVADL